MASQILNLPPESVAKEKILATISDLTALNNYYGVALREITRLRKELEEKEAEISRLRGCDTVADAIRNITGLNPDRTMD